jgi:hypothetical protein
MTDTLTCSRCGVPVPAEWAFHEEAGDTECPRCWHRCEEHELRSTITRLKVERDGLIKALQAINTLYENSNDGVYGIAESMVNIARAKLAKVKS